MALFQLWNIYRFQEIFSIHRGEVMEMAKIGSRDTYHKCLKNLNEWKYIDYLPSHNPYKGSRIRMHTFRTTSGQVQDQNLTSGEIVTVSKTNNNKHYINKNKLSKPENLKEVEEFFLENDGCLKNAELFYNHYQSIGWMIGKSRIIDWKAAAKAWLLKGDLFKPSLKTERPFRDYLHVTRDKDYSEPL